MIKGTASGYKSCKELHVACYASLVEYIIQPSVAVHWYFCVSKSFRLRAETHCNKPLAETECMRCFIIVHCGLLSVNW